MRRRVFGKVVGSSVLHVRTKEGLVMSNNYPNENGNQHEHTEFSYEDYIDAPNEVVRSATSSDQSAFVAIEMSRSIGDMRREFRRTVKKLRSLYTKNEARALIYQYQFDNTMPTRIRLAKKHAVG